MSVSTRYIAAPPDSSLPALVIQLTTLVDSCMIWIGITQEAEEMAEKVVESGRLGSDWACAMPSSDVRSVLSDYNRLLFHRVRKTVLPSLFFAHLIQTSP